MTDAPTGPANPAAGPSKNSNPKRSVADATARRSAGGGGGGGGGGGSSSAAIGIGGGGGGAATRAHGAASLTQRIAVLEATVASKDRRIASQDRRLAELEAENATLRKRRGQHEPAAALQQLVETLGRHEPALMDMVVQLVCQPRHLARCASCRRTRGAGDVCGDGAGPP